MASGRNKQKGVQPALTSLDMSTFVGGDMSTLVGGEILESTEKPRTVDIDLLNPERNRIQILSFIETMTQTNITIILPTSLGRERGYRSIEIVTEDQQIKIGTKR